MTIPQPPPLRPHRTWRRIVIAYGACFLGLLLGGAALHLEENWRGARVWADCEHELKAKGETLAWQAFIPPPIPDKQNLALAPLFARELRYQIDPQTRVFTFGPVAARPDSFRIMPYGGPKPQNLQPAGWDYAKPTDLAGYQRYYRETAGFPRSAQPQSPPADVLLALTRYAPALDELAQAAAQRSLSRFPVVWDAENPFGVALPHYNLEQEFVMALRLRASASLADGHPDDALRDLELCWRLCRDMSKDPSLIAHLEEITCLSVTLTTVWEGLAKRRWPADALVRIRADLQPFDVLADYQSTCRGERAYGLRGIDFMEQHRDLAQFQVFIDPTAAPPKINPFLQLAYRVVPRGWFEYNKAFIARHTQAYVVEAIDPKAHRFYLDKSYAGLSARRTLPFTFTNIFAAMMVPIYDSVGRHTCKLQTGLDEAVTACALERFFLDRQSYPVRLDELVPAYLQRVPTDVIDGASLRYRPLSDGRYQLYGVGWNARDDSGTVAWDSPRHLQDTEGDWVWQYAALQPPPPAK